MPLSYLPAIAVSLQMRSNLQSLCIVGGVVYLFLFHTLFWLPSSVWIFVTKFLHMLDHTFCASLLQANLLWGNNLMSTHLLALPLAEGEDALHGRERHCRHWIAFPVREIYNRQA
jgi:hypothetical protein